MPTLVDIDGVGTVEFDDGLSQDDIKQAIERDILPKYAKTETTTAAPQKSSLAPLFAGEKLGKPEPWSGQLIEPTTPTHPLKGATLAQTIEASDIKKMPVTPLVAAPRLSTEEVKSVTGLPDTAAGILTGFINTAGGIANFFTSPAGAGAAALSTTPVGAALVTGAFAADTLRNVPNLAKETKDAIASGDPQRITEAILQDTIGAEMVLGAVKAGKAAVEPKLKQVVEDVLKPAQPPPDPDLIARNIAAPGTVRPQEIRGQEMPSQIEPPPEGMVTIPSAAFERPVISVFDIRWKDPKLAPPLSEVEPAPDVGPAPGGGPMAGGKISFARTWETFRKGLQQERQTFAEAPPGQPLKVESIPAPVAELAKAAPLTAAAVAEQAKPVVTESPRPQPRRVLTETEASDLVDLTPAYQTVGLLPPGGPQLQALLNKAMGRPQSATPPLQTDVSTPFPDFQPPEVSKKILSNPWGFERIFAAGAAFGSLRRSMKLLSPNLATYWAERGIGDSVSSAIGQQYSWLDKVFQVGKDGKITNITPTREGQSLYISDVFEELQRDPKAYGLNPQQSDALRVIKYLNKEAAKLEDKYDINKQVDNESGDPLDAFGDVEGPKQRGEYFPRVVVEKPPQDVGRASRGAGVGAKQFFEKPRMFDTEAEGWAKGYKYDPSIARRLAYRAQRLYKRVADKRLAADPELGGITKKELLAKLQETYADDLKSGEMTQEDINDIGNSLEQKGRIFQPAFTGKIYSPEIANRINDAFPTTNHWFWHNAAALNNALKTVAWGFDLGVSMIQGQTLLTRYPKLWAEANWNSLRAMVSPEFFPEYVRRNLEPIREMAQMGASVGKMEEYMAGMQRGEWIHRIPFIRQTAGELVKPFARQFQTYLDFSKVELWKAYRQITPRDQWMQTIQAIESVVGGSRMEPLGMGRGRVLAERVLTIAPSYYRSALNLIGGSLTEKGMSGTVLRQALSAYVVGGTALFVGLGIAAGMREEEIKERLNPTSSRFLTWHIRLGGREREIGIGGIVKSLIKLGGQIYKTSVEHPGNWKSLSSSKNPAVRWYRAHAGPILGGGWDQFTGRDFMGQDVDVMRLRESMLPMIARDQFRPAGQPAATWQEYVASFVGLNTFPESLRKQFQMDRELKAHEAFGKRYDEIPFTEQVKITRELQKRPEYEVKEPSTTLQMELALKAAKDRQDRLAAKLTPENSAKLTKLAVLLPGYEAMVTVQRQKMPLTEAQQQRYEALIGVNYNEVLSNVPNSITNLTTPKRQAWINDKLAKARDRAKRQLLGELTKSTSSK